MKIPITSIHPPAIAQLGGKWYAVPSYTEIPPETKLADLDWTPLRPRNTQEQVDKHQVGQYIVEVSGSRVRCTCPGYTFRKTCKHIKPYQRMS